MKYWKLFSTAFMKRWKYQWTKPITLQDLLYFAISMELLRLLLKLYVSYISYL